MSPFTTILLTFAVAALYFTAGLLGRHGYLCERCTMLCYLGISFGVLLFTALTGSWWTSLLAVIAVVIFLWAALNANSRVKT